ncbi:MAG: hypothetical protein HFH53_07590 [Hespellia sp.]|nr:hypothetical protein [Hespellia sp.]
MRKSIKKMVGIRVIAAIASVLVYSGVTTISLLRIEKAQDANAEANSVLNRAQMAEAAHYKWSGNLSNALYTGSEFTGSTDPTTCVLGQWLYGEAGTDDETILGLRSELESLHKELHESATYVLDLMATDPLQAQTYYQQTIQSNLSTLVGLLDQVIERGTELNDSTTVQIRHMILTMHLMCALGLVLVLVCLISLVQYVLRQVIRPILMISDKSRPLQEGQLNLNLEYQADNELGELAEILEKSMELIHSYVEDLNRIMEQLSQCNFDVNTSRTFIGDFQTIEESLGVLTSTLSVTIEKILQAESKVSGNAEQLSNGAQSLSQGAIVQASAVEELYATLDKLSKSASQNVEVAAEARENARLTGEQVTISSDQMEQMVAAMKDISQSSSEISNIISAIENIAFQTNILALNAAVEAARAGEAGKGFAVVSDEVRDLAAKSDQAAKATKELIENSVRATDKGSQIVGEVSQTLKKTLELVTQSNEAIGTITEAMQEEASSISQVTEGISQISSIVQTNSASSEESAAVSTELFEQVHLLEEQTKKFRIRNQR